MTRGQIAIITPDGKLITSAEFNGDMYYDGEGHGKEVLEALKDIETEAEYRTFVEEFNRKNFQYEHEDMFFDCDDSFYDMSTDYFGKWFSDYVYIKNLSGKTVVFTDADKQKIALEPDTLAAFNFGKFYASDAEDFEKREFIEQLGILKNGLGYDMQENYANLWNACADYDNNHHGSYLTDKITDYDFVDDEILEYIVIKEAKGGVDRLRFFIGDTYSDNIYRLDGYGNLANVDNSDFGYLIDDIVQSLEEDITPPFYKEPASL